MGKHHEGALQTDPEVQKMMKQMVQPQVQQELKNMKHDERGKANNSDIDNVVALQVEQTPPNHNKVNATAHKDNVTPLKQMPKSPSDTTLYTPALKKGAETNGLMDKIANFVENIRIEEREAQSQGAANGGDSVRWTIRDDSAGKGTSRRRDNSKQLTSPKRDMAEKSILQAEQFKAQVTAPKGNNFCNINMEQLSPEVEQSAKPGSCQWGRQCKMDHQRRFGW